MNDTISVIIPVYNAEKTLRKCVESIIFGTYRDVEVILVEDHSKDESWALCQKLSQQYSNILALRNDRNRGVSHTRNRGLAAATGDYILFCDSDDWLSGHYVQELLTIAQDAADALPICGFHFLDYLQNTQQDYVWESGSGAIADLPLESAFEVMDKTLLQQLWTKIFRRSVICKHNLTFDENQSIGEDFQFILEYIRCGSISRFRILDKALYYYTRTNGSLMAKFGLVQQENEYARLKILRDLTGNEARYIVALSQLKKNYVFHAMRSSLSEKEKWEFAKKLLGNDAATFYRQQQLLRFKAAALSGLTWGIHLLPRIKSKLQLIKNALSLCFIKNQLTTKNVTILSQNCIGGVLYHDMCLEFQSPTINLFFSGADFIQFAEAPEKYMSMDLHCVWEEEYPVGLLGDLKVHFMHYNSCSEALAAWTRRLNRVQTDKIVLLCTDRDGFSPELFARWQQLSYPKVLFTANPSYVDADSVFFQKYQNKLLVPDLIPRREFYKDGKVIATLNKTAGDFS